MSRWGQRNRCSSISSIHARLPGKDCQTSTDNDEDSYDMVDDQLVFIKEEDDDGDYSIYSDDDRKPPVQESYPPTTVRVKQEDSDVEMTDITIIACMSEDGHSLEDMSIENESRGEERAKDTPNPREKRRVRRRLIYDEISYFDKSSHDDDHDENFLDKERIVYQEGSTILKLGTTITYKQGPRRGE